MHDGAHNRVAHGGSTIWTTSELCQPLSLKKGGLQFAVQSTIREAYSKAHNSAIEPTVGVHRRVYSRAYSIQPTGKTRVMHNRVYIIVRSTTRLALA